MVFSSVISGCGSLGEPIGLKLVRITAKQFNVDFIQIITLKVERGDDTFTLGCLHHHFNLTKHDVEVGLDGRVV